MAHNLMAQGTSGQATGRKEFFLTAVAGWAAHGVSDTVAFRKVSGETLQRIELCDRE